jgi:hypothetical protein
MFDAGAAVGRLIIDSSEFKSGMKNAQKSLDAFTKQLDKMGTILSVTVTAPLVMMATQAIGAWADMEKATSKLNAILKSTGNVVGYSSKEMTDMAENMMKLNGVENDLIVNSEAILLTFKAIGHDIFPRAEQAAIDISAAFGQDLQSATVMLGKALQEPVQGLAALRRVGIQLTDEQEKLIKSMVEMNDVAGAQAIILKEIESQVGGVAEAMTKTNTGAMKQMQVEWGELLEDCGRLIMEGLRPLVDIARQLIAQFSGLDDNQKKFILTVAALAAGVGPAILAFSSLLKVFQGISTFAMTNPIGMIAVAIAGAIGLAVTATAALIANTEAEQRAQESWAYVAKESAKSTDQWTNSIGLLNDALGKYVILGQKTTFSSADLKTELDKVNKAIADQKLKLEGVGKVFDANNKVIKENLFVTSAEETTAQRKAKLDAQRLPLQNELNRLIAQAQSLQTGYNSALFVETQAKKDQEKVDAIRREIKLSEMTDIQKAIFLLGEERDKYMANGLSKNEADKWYNIQYGKLLEERTEKERIEAQKILDNNIKNTMSIKKNFAETAEENYRAWSKANTKIVASTDEAAEKQKQAIQKLQQDFENIYASIGTAFASIISSTFEALAKGENAWVVFAKAGLNAVAMLLDSIGQLLLAQAALNFLNIPLMLAYASGATAAFIASGLIRGWAASFAQGGDFVTAGPQLIMVGDNPCGREHVTVEPMNGDAGETDANPGVIVNFYGPVNSEIDINKAMAAAAIKFRSTRRSM